MIDKNEELLKGCEWLEDFEGYEAKPYLDSQNIETCGIGRNLEVYPFDDEELASIEANNGDWSHVEAVAWTYKHLSDTRLMLVVGAPWVLQQPVNVRLILTDMAYNIGLAGLWNFKKMLAAMKAYDYPKAAKELKDSLYYTQTGRRSKHHYDMLMETECPSVINA